MKKNSARSEKFRAQLYDLSESGVNFRSKWRAIFGVSVWLALSGISSLVSFFTIADRTQLAAAIGLNFLKYLPMLFAAYYFARALAAKYLADVYEIEDPSVAEAFIEQVTFNPSASGHVVVIEDGNLEEGAQDSPLMQIGGPGYVQVNLDSAVLVEKINGEPEVIYPSSGMWRLGSFERIREVGEAPRSGEPQYAIINLREQSVKNIEARGRTKDGIPVEVHGVSVKFHVRRKPGAELRDFACDEDAVRALVYQQMTITPVKKIFAGTGFPWNTTIIPLIVSEIEKVISSHTADEISVGVGNKELAANADIENTAQQAQVEATGKNLPANGAKQALAHAHESREKIEAMFLEEPFISKAAALGVEVTSINIGTWEPVEAIKEKIRGAWMQARENKANHSRLSALKKKLETEETLKLIDSVINPLHERLNARGDSKQKEKQLLAKELQEMAAKNPNLVVNSDMLAPFMEDTRQATAALARDMLKAFRKELLAGKAQLLAKKESAPEQDSAARQAQIQKIESVLASINQYFPR